MQSFVGKCIQIEGIYETIKILISTFVETQKSLSFYLQSLYHILENH